VNSIPKNKKRELRQLWDGVTALMDFAKNEFVELPPDKRDITCKQLAKAYKNRIPTDKDLRKLNKVNAFLSSAAVRLATISEILSPYGIIILKDDYLKSNKKHRRDGEQSFIKNDLQKNLTTYIHRLLRDNIGHKEPLEDENKKEKKKNMKNLYNARQNALEALKVSKVYTLMENVVKKFEKRLRKEGVV
jgi:ribosomal protein L20